MIIDAMVSILMTVLTALVDVLPTAGTLSLGAGTGFIAAYTWINHILPVGEALSNTVVLMGVMGAVFLARTLLTIWGAIPLKFS